jgi:hypothetical protein
MRRWWPLGRKHRQSAKYSPPHHLGSRRRAKVVTIDVRKTEAGAQSDEVLDMSLPPSTSANIPQNVGWQFMGHMVRTTFVLPAVMAVSTSNTAQE